MGFAAPPRLGGQAMKDDMDSGMKIAAWMKEKIKRFQCPVCQHLVWNTSEEIYSLTSDSGPCKPRGVVTLQCANCASLTFFDAASMGIVASVPILNKDVHMETTASEGLDPLVAEIQQHLKKHPGDWLKRLQNDPAGAAKLDQEIHLAFAHLADRMVAGLMAAAAGPSAAPNKK